VPIYNKNRTLQQEAHYQVQRAIRLGHISPPSAYQCVDCGNPAKEYDHRDYTKPLAIEPTCIRCNRRRGPAFGVISKRILRPDLLLADTELKAA